MNDEQDDWGVERPPAEGPNPWLIALDLFGRACFVVIGFVFAYMVAFAAVVWGICRGAGKGGHR